MYGTGTIMTNRVKGYNFMEDKEMKRGQFKEVVRSDHKVCLTKWKDNKSVLMISTAFGSQPETTVRRWDQNLKERVDVPCPNMVYNYNQKMGVICDQMIEYYRYFFKTRKWTLKVILHLFDLAIVNSWMEYRSNCKSMNVKKKLDLLEFRLNFGEYLVGRTKKKDANDNQSVTENEEQEEEEESEKQNVRKKRKVHPQLPCADKRYDGFEHWPASEDLKDPLACGLESCSSRSRVRCTKCNSYFVS